MSRFALSAFAALLLSLSFASSVSAQSEPDVAQGLKLYDSYQGSGIDNVTFTINNVFVHADLMQYSQRGGELSYPVVLQYSGKGFGVHQTPCPPGTKLGNGCTLRFTVVFGPDPFNDSQFSRGNSVKIGFMGVTEVGGPIQLDTPYSFDGNEKFVSPSSATTPDGSIHQLATTDSGMVALDGSGFAGGGSLGLLDSSGTTSGGGSAVDRNGNQLSAATDTLGRRIPAVPAPNSPSTASLGSCPVLSDYPNQPPAYAYEWDLPTVNGGTLPLILCYANVYVRAGSSTSTITEVNQSFPMLQSVVFPDQTFWGFQYDAADPNNTASFGYGDLLKITLPTGGSITYTWASWSFAATFAGISRGLTSRTVDANDGTGPQKWTYSTGLSTDPAGNDTVHVITALGGKRSSLYETETDYYQGSHTAGTLLKTAKTDYQYTDNPYDPAIIAGKPSDDAQTVTNVFPKTVTTILPNGQQSKVEMIYDTALVYHGPLDGIQYNEQTCWQDPSGTTLSGWTPTETVAPTTYHGSYGKVLNKLEYDWGQGAPGPLLRQTVTQYQWQIDSRYLTANLLDLPSSVQVYDGAAHLCARTDYAYDQTAPVTSGIATQHTTPPGEVRGNLTTVTRWLSATPCQAGATWTQIASHTAYYDTGEVASSTDPLGHSTTHSYDPAYAGAYPTHTCSPQTATITHCVSGTYDFNTGLLTSFTDENNQLSTFGYDNRWRMTSAVYPVADASGLHPETDFDPSVPNQIKRKKRLDSANWITDYGYFDGLGRGSKTQLVDPAGDDFVDTTYEELGRVHSASNPHRTSASMTDGITTSYYDALARVVQVAPQDGTLLPAGTSPTSCQPNNICTDYSNFPVVTVIDQEGHQRRSRTDALGRLVEVDEPSSAATAGSGSVTIKGGDGSTTIKHCFPDPTLGFRSVPLILSRIAAPSPSP